MVATRASCGAPNDSGRPGRAQADVVAHHPHAPGRLSAAGAAAAPNVTHRRAKPVASKWMESSRMIFTVVLQGWGCWRNRESSLDDGPVVPQGFYLAEPGHTIETPSAGWDGRPMREGIAQP